MGLALAGWADHLGHSVCRGAGFGVCRRFPGRLALPSCGVSSTWGEWLGWSVGRTPASAARSVRLVERTVVDRLAEVALVAIGADDAFDEGAPVERQHPAGGLPAVCCRSRSSSLSWMVMVFPHPHGSRGTQVVVGMVCSAHTSRNQEV